MEADSIKSVKTFDSITQEQVYNTAHRNWYLLENMSFDQHNQDMQHFDMDFLDAGSVRGGCAEAKVGILR